jgi:hypothetical protein
MMDHCSNIEKCLIFDSCTFKISSVRTRFERDLPSPGNDQLGKEDLNKRSVARPDK